MPSGHINICDCEHSLNQHTHRTLFVMRSEWVREWRICRGPLNATQQKHFKRAFTLCWIGSISNLSWTLEPPLWQLSYCLDSGLFREQEEEGKTSRNKKVYPVTKLEKNPPSKSSASMDACVLAYMMARDLSSRGSPKNRCTVEFWSQWSKNERTKERVRKRRISICVPNSAIVVVVDVKNSILEGFPLHVCMCIM